MKAWSCFLRSRYCVLRVRCQSYNYWRQRCSISSTMPGQFHLHMGHSPAFEGGALTSICGGVGGTHLQFIYYSVLYTDGISAFNITLVDISELWDDTDSWNPLWRKKRPCLYHIINTMVADDLVMEGARASATMYWPNHHGMFRPQLPKGCYEDHLSRHVDSSIKDETALSSVCGMIIPILIRQHLPSSL